MIGVAEYLVQNSSIALLFGIMMARQTKAKWDVMSTLKE